MTDVVDHPLLDGAAAGWAATETTADVAALTTGMLDFVRSVAVDGWRPVVVTGEQARMTPPLADTLSAVGGHWVVRAAPGADAPFYAAASGRPLAAVGDVIAPTGPLDTVHPSFARSPLVTRAQLALSMSTRHRVSRPVRLGGVAEAVSRTLTGSAPEVWGAIEPLVARWDRTDLTERSRRRMPDESRWAFASDGALVGTLSITRTDEGIEEITRVWCDLGAPGDDGVARAQQRATDALRAAAGSGMPLLGIALLVTGAPDLARRPLAAPPPEPLALVVGAPGVRAVGVDAAAWARETGGETIGSPRLPSVLVPLGSAAGGGWQRMTDAVASLDPDRLAELLGGHLAPTTREKSED